MNDVKPIYYIYKLDEGGAAIEDLGEDDQGYDIPAATHWVLPTLDFHNLWDTLFFDSDIKEQVGS